MCSHELIDRDDTLMYTKEYNFLLLGYPPQITSWVLHVAPSIGYARPTERIWYLLW
jgi:hypothetical protein